jgi:cytochrome c-type biogenesis protein
MSSALAVASALWLGLLTSVSPCPLATNVAAVSFVSRRFLRPGAVLLSGILYTLGRVVTYAVLGALIAAGLLGASRVSFFLQFSMGTFLGPAMILIGMVILDLIRIPLPSGGWLGRVEERAGRWGHPGSFVLGILFAMAFCPVSAALFFGGLMSLAVERESMVLLPTVYGIGTGLPVALVAVLFAVGLKGVGTIVQRVASIELWARRATGVIFILLGIYETFLALRGAI